MQVGISFTSDVFDIFIGYEIRRTCTMTSWTSPTTPLGRRDGFTFAFWCLGFYRMADIGGGHIHIQDIE